MQIYIHSILIYTCKYTNFTLQIQDNNESFMHFLIRKRLDSLPCIEISMLRVERYRTYNAPF